MQSRSWTTRDMKPKPRLNRSNHAHSDHALFHSLHGAGEGAGEVFVAQHAHGHDGEFFVGRPARATIVKEGDDAAHQLVRGWSARGFRRGGH